MAELKNKLTDALLKISGMTLETWQGENGLFEAFSFRGKDFAHFHNDHEIDIKLTKKIIQAQALVHPKDCIQHPKRSPNSSWIVMRFYSQKDISYILNCVKLALSFNID